MYIQPRKIGPRKRVAAAVALVLIAGTGVANAVTSTPVVGLLVSKTATHADPSRLAHSSLDRVEYIFLNNASSTTISSVSYYLDDAIAASSPFATATAEPFDMSANGLDTSTLTEGTHTLLAVLQVNGVERDLFARFAVHPATAPDPTTVPTVPTPVTLPPTTAPAPMPTVPPTTTPLQQRSQRLRACVHSPVATAPPFFGIRLPMPQPLPTTRCTATARS